MSGIYTVLNDSQAGMFRLKQASRWADPDEKRNSLTDKAKDAALAFSLDPDFARNANAAITAMEEARKIAAPKAMAEQRLQEVEQRMKELRQEARLAAARGDREKLAQLAREAAQLARKAGKAASEFSVGVSNAAAMGKGAGTGTEITTTIRQSQTTVSLTQTETVVQVTLSGDAAAALAAQVAADPAATAPVTAPPMPAAPGPGGEGELPDMSPEDMSPEDMSPEDLAAFAEDTLAALGSVLPGAASGGMDMRAFAARAAEDHRLGLARWKEADEFGRRVESVLYQAKSVISEAKIANETDEDYDRRRERRKELDDYDKAIGESQEAVNDLRAAAFGTSAALVTGAEALAATAAPSGTAPITVAAPVTVDLTA
ncbi:hypothetical protein HL658_01140 [Azospirillum sp. RWY-5-1]|uniref:Uncharacterized protein n=1 Tax=Azospirillum oleiclasticum TaxID=2735135 RepID=A0ABX2T2G3_9PROT|nr:hypothetical protein [Azospirillum oleiclasticum]NYZ11139.1 hypothetical protein [Azospirillum oleiclasticum]NYZ18301.1 hypothetical protein [Azospirillum oleiclasticum]